MWSKFKQSDWKKISLYVFLSTLLISLVVFICNTLFKDAINFYLPKIFIYIINIIFFLVVFYLYQDRWEKKIKSFKYFILLEKITKYIFLCSLLIITFIGFENFLTQWQDKAIILNILFFIAVIKGWQIFLIITAIVSGSFVFFVNRERVEEEIEKEKINEEKAEEKRYNEFKNKFPRINRIWGLKNIVRWCYKEGYIYSFGLITIIILGIIYRAWYLGRMGFWFDEGLSVLMAHSFLTDNLFTFPSGLFYERALPYHYYLGIINLIFHKIIPEIIFLRIANLPFYIINSFLIYFLSKKILPKYTGIFAVFLFSISWIAISMFREARFYELSLTVYLSLSLIFINYFKYFNLKSIVFSILERKKNLIGIIYLLLIFYIGFLIHPLIVIFLYVLAMFYFIISFKYKNYEYFIISFLTILPIFTGMFLLIKKTFPFVDKFNILYLLKLPSPEWASLSQSNSINNVLNYLILNEHLFILLILITLPPIILLEKNREKIFIYTSLTVIYLFLSYQGYDYNSIRYYYVVIPFLLITFSSICLNIFKIEKKIFTIIFILTMIPYFMMSFEEINATKNFNSKNIMKSFDYNSAFSFVGANKPSKVFTDSQISVPYYIYFSKKPDKIIYDSSVLTMSSSTDQYLGVPYSSYDIFFDKHNCKTYFIMIYMRTQISQQNWQILNQKSKLLYQDKALLVYEIF